MSDYGRWREAEAKKFSTWYSSGKLEALAFASWCKARGRISTDILDVQLFSFWFHKKSGYLQTLSEEQVAREAWFAAIQKDAPDDD